MDHKTKLGAGVRPLQGGGGIFKSAAVAVLRKERRLMTTGEITKVALDTSLITCQGRTPEATMASALYTDIKRKLDHSVFTRPQEGLFGLREWEHEGFVPDPVLSAGPSLSQQTTSSPMTKRLRGPSTRVIKRPERFTTDDFEGSIDDTARSTPSPLLDMEHHSRMLAASPGQLSLMHPLGSKATRGASPASDVCGPAAPSLALAGPGPEEAQQLGPADGSTAHRQPRQDREPPLPADESPTKRPCLEVELPAWEAMPADLHQLFWTPAAAAPLSVALAAPGLLDGVLGGLPSLGQPAEHADDPESTSRGESNEVKLEEDSLPGILDTPQLLQLPLPEGDLSWSPLGAFGASAQQQDWAFPPVPSALEHSWAQASDRAGPNGISAPGGPADALVAAAPAMPDSSPAQSGGSGSWAGAEARLAAMEAEAAAQEAALGADHPLVGKAWLALSRAYQAQDPRRYADKAEHALIRAWRICSACFSKCHNRPASDAPFNFLLDRIQNARY